MKKSKNIFWGVAIILVAVLIILSNVPAITVFSIFSLWDIILLVILAAFLIKGIADKELFAIVIPLGLIYYLVVKDLDAHEMLPAYIPNLGLWTIILISFLISVGCALIFKKNPGVKITVNGKDKVIDGEVSEQHTSESGVVNIENNMGTTTKYIDCANFRELNADNNFGQLNLYLSNCSLASAQCKVNLDNNFGNINLYLPKEWQAVLNPDSSFGKVEFHKTMDAPAGAPIAYVNADSSFGSIEIYQV